MDGADIMAILEGRVTLPDLLYKKRRKATETGNIYVTFQSYSRNDYMFKEFKERII